MHCLVHLTLLVLFGTASIIVVHMIVFLQYCTISIWTNAPNLWLDRFDNVSGYLLMLSEGFLPLKNEPISFEAAHNTIQLELHLDSMEYPMGTAFMCLAALTHRMMVKEEHHTSETTFLSCVACGYKGNTLLHIGKYLSLNDMGLFHNGMCEKGQISN